MIHLQSISENLENDLFNTYYKEYNKRIECMFRSRFPWFMKNERRMKLLKLLANPVIEQSQLENTYNDKKYTLTLSQFVRIKYKFPFCKIKYID